MQLKRSIWFVVLTATLWACKEDKTEEITEDIAVIEEVEEHFEFGFNLDDFIVKRDTIKSGDSFGVILERNNLGYPKIFQIAEKAKDSFDIRRLQVGKPYTLLCAKDSLETPQSFIYQPNKIDYVVIDFQDSIQAYNGKKPIKYVEREASGVIPQGSGISMVLDKKGLSQRLANKMANDIYAWTIDFNRLQPGDRFKVIYTDKYIDDSVYAGVDQVKAAYFEHNKKPFYAFEFETDSVKGVIDYLSEEGKNLRRAFLKSPIKFGGRVSSRYNLKRRIAHYGYRVKAHRGTDFAAANGTPILATANGTVTKSSYTRGNGKYVKIRHNATYETQYLHMSKRKVKVGQFVKQGDIIGLVGNTGSSAGNHVCYRFWKNGKQVDPFKQKLPEAKPISDSLKVKFLDYMVPIKQRLDKIILVEDSLPPETEETLSEIQ
ncbi:peptidoglycan DD-metalloendopeptidase family protein [Winogradskyella sp.]|uniref:peptidoglycan DD-metalloendopeptidase family protein n=1 Tax=Winogradskyella sp. TaxID=1883156 RepID=UPI0025DA4A2C|nr:peptidoglycan DD-metalloendopeptidase family protein [Winogradskyella sp.]